MSTRQFTRLQLPVLLLALVLMACGEDGAVTAPIGPDGIRRQEGFPGSEGAAGGFTAIDLGSLGDPGWWSAAYDINEVGQVVGWSGSRAFLWENGEMIDLGDLGGQTTANDINEVGQVVGWGLNAEWMFRAFLWENGTITDLGDLGGGYADAEWVNDAGQVLGTSLTTGGEAHAYVWQSGEIIDLFPWSLRSHPGGISESGYIVGELADGSVPRYKAFIWNGNGEFTIWDVGGLDVSVGGINDSLQIIAAVNVLPGVKRALLFDNAIGDWINLGTLGGESSTAYDINEVGQVVGQSTTAGGERHPFLWENGEMIDLGTLGGEWGYAYDINEVGQVAGQSTTAGGDGHAFLWENGEIFDLGTLGGAWSNVEAINDAGHVVGQAETSDGVYHAVLWRRLSPDEANEAIVEGVDELEAAGIINKGQAKSLRTKLDIATAMLNDGKLTAAVNLLEAFILEVEGLIDGGVLTPEEGQPLIDAARAIIESIG